LGTTVWLFRFSDPLLDGHCGHRDLEYGRAGLTTDLLAAEVLGEGVGGAAAGTTDLNRHGAPLLRIAAMRERETLSRDSMVGM
jgi:hypothetical protein